jgi:hypothetical protein
VEELLDDAPEEDQGTLYDEVAEAAMQAHLEQTENAKRSDGTQFVKTHVLKALICAAIYYFL